MQLSELTNIRKKIDELDDKIAELLQQRWQQVKNISQLKKLSKQQSGYRPFREQDIFERLPDDAVVPKLDYWSIWKELMTTTVMRENPFDIGVALEFWHQHGFYLAQEFGRRALWSVYRNEQTLWQALATRKIGLAVVSSASLINFLHKGGALNGKLLNGQALTKPKNPIKDKMMSCAVLNIFPSYYFDRRKTMGQKDVYGFIVGWDLVESAAEFHLNNRERLDKKLLLIYQKGKLKLLKATIGFDAKWQKNLLKHLPDKKKSVIMPLTFLPKPNNWKD